MHRLQLPGTAALSDTLSNSIGWFRPNNIKNAVVNNSLLFSATLINLVAEAHAICFETPYSNNYGNYDTELQCYGPNSETDLANALYAKCGAFPGQAGQDFINDACPNILVQVLEYGHGVFGGPGCFMKFHQTDIFGTPIQVNPCVDNYLKDNVKSGYGTIEDGFATAGIVVGACVSIALIAKCGHSVFFAQKKTDKQPLLENGPSEIETPTPPAPDFGPAESPEYSALSFTK